MLLRSTKFEKTYCQSVLTLGAFFLLLFISRHRLCGASACEFSVTVKIIKIRSKPILFKFIMVS